MEAFGGGGVISDHIMNKAARSELHFDTVRQALAEAHGGSKRADDESSAHPGQHLRLLYFSDIIIIMLCVSFA